MNQSRLSTIVVAAVLAAAVVAGCVNPEPQVVRTVIDGTPVVQHIDTDDSPAGCGDRIEWSGCYAMVKGEHHIWHSSHVSPGVIKHEVAHAKGMRHTEWRWNFWKTAKCTTITVEATGYPLGARLCVDWRGESIN